MKKIWTRFLTLGCILTCIFTLTICSTKSEAANLDYNETNLSEFIDQLFSVMQNDESLNYFLKMDDSELNTQLESYGISAKVLKETLQSFKDLKSKYGEYKSKSEYKFAATDKNVTVTTTVKCAKHNVIAKVHYDKNLNITSITFNKQNAFVEVVERAGTNTIIGAGALIIVLMLLLGYTLGKRSQNVQPDQASISNNERVMDTMHVQNNIENTELVAVIAAAIAASMGTTSTEGFVVRSIKKRRK